MIRQKIISTISLLAILASLLTACDTGRSATLELDGVRLTLSSPQEYYKEGETIRVSVTVENITSQTVIIENTNRPVFDVTYMNNGVEVSWIEQHPELSTNRLELAPGEKIETEISFIPSKEDSYTFTGFLASQTLRNFVKLAVLYGTALG